MKRNAGKDSPLPMGEEKERFVREMFDKISPGYDRLNRLLTFNLDQFWRRTTLSRLDLPRGARILDLACGTGDFVKLASSMGYNCIGTDFSMGMLMNSGLSSGLVASDGKHLAFADSVFEGATCGFALRNFSDLTLVLSELSRVVMRGGKIGLLEVAQPTNPVLKFGHELYFNKIVPLVGGILSDSSAYRYLPASVSYLPQRHELCSMIQANGFTDAQHELLFSGAAQLFTARRA